MSDLINILSIIDDKSQLINFPKLDPNSFKPAVLCDANWYNMYPTRGFIPRP